MKSKNKYFKDETSIDIYFDEFLDKIRKKGDIRNEYLQEIKCAYEFSKKAHRNQKRKTGEPYIIHPVEVSKLVYQNGLGTHSIMAALLHDTVEDTEVTLEDIENNFGKEIRELVDSLTKIDESQNTKDVNNLETLKKILLITIKDVRVLVIKICDRLHNMRTIQFLPENKIAIKSKETLEVFVPLAQKVGLYNLKWELEDICLKYTKRKIYNFIKQKIKIKKNEREKILNNIIEVVDNRIKETSSKKYSIYGRLKNFYSIYKKIKDKFKSFDDIYDLYAIRILVDSVEDCYLMFGIIQGTFQTFPDKIKDYISNPKSNGYKSIHTVIFLEEFKFPIEIQIRTNEMHNLAEFGIAAHYRYKNIENDNIFEKKISWLREIFEFEKEHKSDLNLNFLSILKSDFFDDEIFVLTPQKKVIVLPENSIGLDFAYAIHTDIGHKAYKCRVNGEAKPLDTTLKNGDIVEVLTKKNNSLSSKYLSLLKSTKAKIKLRHKLNLKKISKRNKEEIIYNDKNLLEYVKDIDYYKNKKISNCCRVDRESSIIGVVNKKDIVIHNKDCIRVKSVLDDRKINLKWIKLNTEKISLIIYLKNKHGILGDILEILNDFKVSIFEVKSSLKLKDSVILDLKILKDNSFDKLLKKLKEYSHTLKIEVEKKFS